MNNIHGPNVPSSFIRKGDLGPCPLSISDIDEMGSEILTLFQRGCLATLQRWGCEVNENLEGDFFVMFKDGGCAWMDELPDFGRMNHGRLSEIFGLNFWAGIRGIERMERSFLFAIPELCGFNPDNLTTLFPDLFAMGWEECGCECCAPGYSFVEFIG